MIDAKETKSADPSAQSIDKIYMENTLLRVFGVLFCHDAKSARQRSGTIAVNRGVKERNLSVRIDPEYAQPGPFAHKVAMAVIRKQSSYGRPAQKLISFSQRELMRLTGRKSWGGRQSEQLALALKQIRYAHVLAHFQVADRFVEHDFSIFNEIMLERRASPTDPIIHAPSCSPIRLFNPSTTGTSLASITSLCNSSARSGKHCTSDSFFNVWLGLHGRGWSGVPLDAVRLRAAAEDFSRRRSAHAAINPHDPSSRLSAGPPPDTRNITTGSTS